MLNNDENNSNLLIKNNSTQNLYLSSHHQNKSSNNLTDSPSTFITVQLQSKNNNKNSKGKDKNNLENKNNNIYEKNIKKMNIKEDEQKKNEEKLFLNEIKENNTSPKAKLDKNSFKDINNFRKKLSKICGQYSTNTPKQIISIYKGIEKIKGIEQNDDILVKKNLKLRIQKS